MKCSTERILTTHTGSLPRPGKLLEMIASGNMSGCKDDPTFRERGAIGGERDGARCRPPPAST